MKEKSKKKHILFVILPILLILSFVAIATYAYWQLTKKQTDTNQIISACLNFELVDAVTGKTHIGLQNQFPMSNQDALNDLEGYSFKVINNCPEDVNYIIALENYNVENVINSNSISVALDNNLVGNFGSIAIDVTPEDTTAIGAKQLGISTVAGNSYNTHNLKLWINNDSPISDQGKVFNAKIFIMGGQGINNENTIATPDRCFRMIGNTLAKYDFSCGTDVVIPENVNGVPVKEIAPNAFKVNNYYAYNTMTGEQIDSDDIDISEFDIGFYETTNNSPTTHRENYDDFKFYGVLILNEDPSLVSFAEMALSGMFPDLDDSDIDELLLYDVPSLNYKDELGLIKFRRDAGGNIILDTENPEKMYTIYQDVPELGIDSLDLSKASFLEKIGDFAFTSCYSENNDQEKSIICPETGVKYLTNLNFGNNENVIDLGMGTFAHMDMSGKTLDVYTSYDGMLPFLLGKVDTLNIHPTATNKTIGVGEGVRVFPDSRWESYINTYMTGLMAITTLNVEEGITTIEDDSFALNGMLYVNLPSTITSIGASALEFVPENGTITINKANSGITYGENWNKRCSNVIYNTN